MSGPPPLARAIVLTDDGAMPYSDALAAFDATVATTLPAPTFTAAPSITGGGTVGQQFTGNDGTIVNGAVSARAWLLNGSVITGATGATYTPTTAGSYAYRVTATGSGGTTAATSAMASVAAATGFYSNGAANSAWKAAVARVKAGTGRAKLAVLSDSVYSAGQGAGTGAAGITGARVLRQSTIAAQTLTAAGIQARDLAILGDTGVSNQNPFVNYDPRLSFQGASPWSVDPENFAPGLAFFHPSADGTTAVFDFSAIPYDHLEFVFADYAAATIQYLNIVGNAADGGLHTLNLTGSGQFVRTVLPCTRAGGMLRMLQNGAGATALISMMPFDSTIPAIDFRVHGGCGYGSTQMLGSGAFYDGFHFLDFDPADLYVVALDINDYNQGLSADQHIANIDTIVTKCLTHGNVLLVTEHETGLSTQAMRDAYAAANKSYAAGKGIAHYSIREKLGAYSSYSGQLVDGTHGNAQFNHDRGVDLAGIYQQLAS